MRTSDKHPSFETQGTYSSNFRPARRRHTGGIKEFGSRHGLGDTRTFSSVESGWRQVQRFTSLGAAGLPFLKHRGESMSDNIKAKFAKLQAELPQVGHDKQNPHFKSQYCSLEAIQTVVLPVVEKHGFCLVFGCGEEVTATLFYGDTEVSTGSFPLPNTPNPQVLGSHMTYARRYLTCLLLNVKTSGDDDDGNTSAGTDSDKPLRRLTTAELKDKVFDLMESTHTDKDELAKHLGVGSLDSKRMTQRQLQKLVDYMEAKSGED